MKKLALCAGHYLGTEGRRCLKQYDPNETQEWVLNDRIADRVDGEDPVPIPASYGAHILSAVEAKTITSPNGTVYKLKVTDNGELYTEAV